MSDILQQPAFHIRLGSRRIGPHDISAAGFTWLISEKASRSSSLSVATCTLEMSKIANLLGLDSHLPGGCQEVCS